MRLHSLNRYWRILAAGLSYVIFGIGAFLPGLYILCLAMIPMNASTKQKKVRQSIKILCRVYIDFLQFIGLMSYQIEKYSADKLEGHLVIANHSMLIDALFALAYIDNLCCIVKSELCRNIFTRLPIRLAGYIPNNTEMLAQLAKQRLDNGENVLIFPEGTRNQHDLQLDFKRGAANIALISDSSILPIVICCNPRALEKGQKWYALPDRKFHVSIRINQPLKIENCINRELPRSMQYRRLTEWLRNYYTEQVSQIIS